MFTMFTLARPEAPTCLEVAAARRAGHPTLGLCVNLSAHQFDHPGVVERIGSALAEAELPPEFLELEITETVAMRDVEATASCLRRLKDMGTRIAIDDFGTGYSGLSYLKRFSLDTLRTTVPPGRKWRSRDPRAGGLQLRIDRLVLASVLALVALGVRADTPPAGFKVIANWGADFLRP
jgi:hypothetical protein